MTDNSSFRNRGGETTRVEAFVDAAFAFALTLLVISFDAIPQSYAQLLEALKGVPAFAACFAIISMFWLAHRNWSKRFGLDTTVSTLISLMLVFVILVYVYPLRTMMSATFNILTGGWAPSSFKFELASDVRGFFTIYGIGFVLACLTIVMLNVHAWRQRRVLQLSELETHMTVSECLAWSIVGGVGLLSIVCALLLPNNWLPLAGWSYSLLPVLMYVFSLVRQRSAPHRLADNN